MDLSRAPLLRLKLVRIHEDRHLCLLDAHHTVFDGISSDLFAEELMRLYRGEALPPLERRYEDYVRREQAYIGSAAYGEDEKYWLERFAGGPPVLDLPTDNPRPPVKTFEGCRVFLDIETETVRGIKEVARKAGASLYMVLSAAHYVLLHHLTGQEDMVAGTTFDGRKTEEFARVLGNFVNTLAIRNRPRGDLPFGEFLKEVKRNVLEAYDHQDYPFEHLVEKLGIQRDISRNPLFDVMFVYEFIETDQAISGDLTFSKFDIANETAMFDLTHEILEFQGGLSMSMEFNTHLFRRETVERFLAYYRNLLREIVKGPERPIRDLDILPAEEKQELLVDFNRTQAEFPRGRAIADLFEAQAKKTPERIAVAHGDAELSYRELDEAANGVARELVRRLAPRPDEFVGMLLDRSHHTIAAILGILKAGAAYLPLDPSYPAERLEYMIRDSGCRVVLTEPRHAATAAAAGVETADALQAVRRPEEEAPPRSTRSGDPAYVIYTSGSTGLPKGCVVTHENVVRLMVNDRHPFDFNESDVWTMAHSYCFDFSVWEMYGALLYGGKLVVPSFESVRDAAAFLGLVRRHRVTVLNQTPGAFYNLIQEELRSTEGASSTDGDGEHLLDEHLRYVIFGGDRLEPSYLAPWIDRYSPEQIRLVNMYGITETTVHVTFCALTEEDIRSSRGLSPIGAPIPETTLYLLNEAMKPVPKGVVGEIYVGGTGVCLGYLNRPELTGQRFVPSPFKEGERLYKSGDLGKRLHDGTLVHLGRNDDQVQIKGYRVELGEIQKRLLDHPGIDEAVVTARPVRGDLPELVAYVVARPGGFDGGVVSIPELRSHLGRRLPDYMVPPYFVPVERFPLTSNGKIDRKALPDPLEAASGEGSLQAGEARGGEERVAPRTDEEKLLAGVWEAVLGRKNIGARDNFFVLGGDSIKAIQIVSRLRETGFKLTVRHLFEFPCIEELAAKMTGEGGASRTEPKPTPTSGPLTPIQAAFLRIQEEIPHHYAQGVLLKASRPVDEAALEATLQAILEHHDALRLRLKDCEFPAKDATGSGRSEKSAWWSVAGGQWGENVAVRTLHHRTEAKGTRTERDRGSLGPQSSVLSPQPPVLGPRSCVDLRGMADAQERMDEECGKLCASLDLFRGPLVKAMLFRTDDGDRLLWVVHHMAVDGVSWRILLEDLERGYEQASQGSPVKLPPPADSFLHWSARLEALGGSGELLEELDYWKEVEREAAELPDSNGLLPVKDSEATNKTPQPPVVQSECLSREQTEALLHSASRVLQAEARDVLLTALARAVRRQGREGILIDLEGHGREPLFDDADASRTVGWLTTLYPFVLRLPPAGREASPGGSAREVADHVGHIREKLRRIPRNGAGYGILEQHRDLALRPRVVFNYLGRFDASREEGVFAIVPRRVPRTVGEGVREIHDLEIEARIVDDELELAVIGPCTQEARKLLKDFRRELEEISILVSSSSLPVENTAKERPRPETGSQGPETENIYPLSPTQEGMLFERLYEDRPDSYLGQFSFTARGELDPGVFQKCWDLLVERYDILRTVFMHRGLERPVQKVLAERPVEVLLEDLRGMAADEQARRVEEFKTLDRQRGFVLDRDPLMRVSVFQRSEDCWDVVWTHHHILMDGWCFGIVIGELFAAYESLRQGKPPEFKPAPPYRDYIRYIERADKEASLAYWEQYLSGYERPAGRLDLDVDSGTWSRRQSGSREPEVGDEGSERSGERTECLRRVLDEERTAKLKAAAARSRATLNATVQSAWGIRIGHWNRSADVVFGGAVSGRPAEVPGIEDMVGLFINTVPVRIRADGVARFDELARKTQKEALESEPHHYCSLADVQPLTPLNRDLLDHVVVFENYPLSEELLRLNEGFRLGFSVEDVDVYIQTHFPLRLVLQPGARLEVELHFDPVRYPRESMEEILAGFEGLLDAVAEDPTCSLQSMRQKLMSDKERAEEEAFLQASLDIDEDF